MNRGFNYYFREGVRSSAKALFKNKNYLRYLIYFFMEFVGRLLLLPALLFGLSNVKQGKMIWQQKRVDLSQSFKDVGDPHSVWTYALTLLVEGLMLLAGILAIATFTALLAGLGYAISLVSDRLNSTLFIIIFSVPGAILTLVYLVIMPLIFAPTAYVIAENKGIGVGDTLSACFNTMKANGKWTLFLSIFIPALIKLVYLAIVGTVTYFMADALGDVSYGAIILIVWGILAFLAFAFFAPVFTLTTRSATHHLFQDIVLDPVSASRSVKGINVANCKGKKFKADEIGIQMVSMFDDTEADEYIVPEAKETQAAPIRQVNLADAYESPAKRKPVKEAKKPSEPLNAEETAVSPSVEEEKTEEFAPEKTEVLAPEKTEEAIPAKEVKTQELNSEKEEETEELLRVEDITAEEPAEFKAEPEIKPEPKPEMKEESEEEEKPFYCPAENEDELEEEGELETISGILSGVDGEE